MADGLQLFAQAVDVEHHHPLVQVHGAVVAEDVQGAGGEQLQRQGDLPRFPPPAVPSTFLGGRREWVQCSSVPLLHTSPRTAVNDGLLLGPHALGVDALHQRHNELRLHHNGVVFAVAVHHIHSVEPVFPQRPPGSRSLHRPWLQWGGILTLRVRNQNVIIRIENEGTQFPLSH